MLIDNSQRNSTTASEQLLQLRDQFAQFRRESDSIQHCTHQVTGGTATQTRVGAENVKCMEIKIYWAERRMSQANTNLRSQVDELNAKLNYTFDFSRPMSGRSGALSEMASTIAGNKMTNNQSDDHNEIASDNNTASQHDGPRKVKGEEPNPMSNYPMLTSRLGSSSSSARPTSKVSVTSVTSLNEEVDSIMHEKGDGSTASAIERAASILRRSRVEAALEQPPEANSDYSSAQLKTSPRSSRPWSKMTAIDEISWDGVDSILNEKGTSNGSNSQRNGPID